MRSSGFGHCIDLKQKRSATFSVDRKYRYWLQRRNTHGEGWCVFCLLNPSTADETHSDPTLRRCVDFSLQWGYEGLIIVNLFSAVSTDPDELMEMDDPVGRLNKGALLYACEVAKRGGVFVAGWGSHVMGRSASSTVLKLIREQKVQIKCLGTTREHMPRHPLYLASETELEPYVY